MRAVPMVIRFWEKVNKLGPMTTLEIAQNVEVVWKEA